MKVAVLGSNGFMGRYFLSVHDDWHGITRHDVDLMNQNEVELFLKKSNFDVIIHCAVLGGSMLKEETGDVTHSNILMFENVRRVFKGKLIYISSGASTLGNPPTKPYGLSKWIIEKRIRQISDAYILRVFWCYGSGDGSSVYRDRFKSICKHDGHITIDKDKYFDMIDVEDVRRVIHDYVCNIRCEKEIDLVYEKKMLLSEWATFFGATYDIVDNTSLDTPYISYGDRTRLSN